MCFDELASGSWMKRNMLTTHQGSETGRPYRALPDGLDFSAMDARRACRVEDARVYTGRDTGASPGLVFVAGGYHGAWCYSHYLDFFAGRAVDCFAVDLPGQWPHAESWQACAGLGIEDQARALRAVCVQLDRPLVLAGHSMGALPVMGAADLACVRGVVLLAPSPPGNLPGAAPVPAVPVGGMVPPPDEAAVRRRFLDVDDAAPVDDLLRRLTPASPGMLNERYLLRYTVDPAGVACPGICFEAELDDSARHPQGQDKAVADFFGFEYRLLKKQPHSMMYGPRWRESAEEILRWYRRQGF
ncbi:alpha/beta hydrolase family protein [Paracandidimonas soli]|uniref:Alpha/beta hydrolase family protein n=2 Tax=Paracandidimonas soli TaxID=1917182 RepID=A0A4R3UXP2_9BURK|nr:alpha/beta hydrolase family protein [Paracandidimonas soli]